MSEDKDILINEYVDPRILAIFLNKTLKDEWIPVLTSTLIDYLQDYYGIEIPQKVKDKIGAIQTMFMNDLFWDQWNIFEKCASALVNKNVRFDIIQTLEPEELSYAIKIADDLRKESYDDEVKSYITISFIDGGSIYPDDYIVDNIFFKDIIKKLNLEELLNTIKLNKKKIKNNDVENIKDPIIREQLRRHFMIQLFLKDAEENYLKQKIEYKL